MKEVDDAAYNDGAGRGKHGNQHKVEHCDERAERKVVLAAGDEPGGKHDEHAADCVEHENRVERALLQKPKERVHKVVAYGNGERGEKPAVKDDRHGKNSVEKERNVQSMVKDMRRKHIQRDGGGADKRGAGGFVHTVSIADWRGRE